MRGDRPCCHLPHPLLQLATPHALGSTAAAYSTMARHSGYPACAGIDLNLINMLRRGVWLPRMRGDRPGG